MQWTVVIALIFALAVGLFAVQNVTPVVIKFFSYKVETSLVVVVLGGIALGALMIGILGLIGQIKARLQIRNLKGKIKFMDKEIAKIKSERDQLLAEKNNMALDLARYEGAQEEILAQEAIESTLTDEETSEEEQVEL